MKAFANAKENNGHCLVTPNWKEVVTCPYLEVLKKEYGSIRLIDLGSLYKLNMDLPYF
jgi:hypothetical protein